MALMIQSFLDVDSWSFVNNPSNYSSEVSYQAFTEKVESSCLEHSSFERCPPIPSNVTFYCFDSHLCFTGIWFHQNRLFYHPQRSSIVGFQSCHRSVDRSLVNVFEHLFSPEPLVLYFCSNIWVLNLFCPYLHLLHCYRGLFDLPND